MFEVFVEALGLVVLAYATFAVVSFIEIKNKYQDNKGGGNLSWDDDDVLGEGYQTRNVQGNTDTKEKGKKKKKVRGGRGRDKGPRACASIYPRRVNSRHANTRCTATSSSRQISGLL